jgi:predicted acyltransferase
MAIAALVCGIANFACYISWIPALILGYMARREIDQSGGTQTGREMAIAGIVLGYIGLGLTVLGLLFFAVALAGLITVGSVGSGAPA